MTAVDDEVVERTMAGDADAWRSLVDAHLPMVRSICIGYGLDEVASAEVNQAVWLRLAEHLPRIRTPAAIGGWVAATTRSECLRPSRSGARSGWVTAKLGPPEACGVTAAFGRVGARCQRLLRLVLSEPCPSDELVSAALDVRPGEIDAACARCLERLSHMMATGRAPAWPGSVQPDDVRHELQQLLTAVGATPASWEEAATVALAWLQLDLPAATLVYEVAGPPRQLRYETGPSSVELEIEADDDELLLTGRLPGDGHNKVTARWPAGAQSTGSDDDGHFRLDGLPTAPLSLHVDGPHPLKTGWILG